MKNLFSFKKVVFTFLFSSFSGFGFGQSTTIVSKITATCTEPVQATATNILYNSANLNWVAPYDLSSPSSYDIEWNSTNIFSGTPTITGITDLKVAISGLSQLTTYYYKVRSNCGGGSYSDWSSTESFTTEGYTPIEVNGFTQDVIANGNSTTAAASTTSSFDLANLNVLISADYNNSQYPNGLPKSRVISNSGTNSPNPAGIKYFLQNYSNNNSLMLDIGMSGTLTFRDSNINKPIAVSELYLGASNGHGGTTANVTINYVGGTSSTADYAINDWLGGSSYISNTNPRLARATSASNAANPRIFQIQLIGINSNLEIASITVTNKTGGRTNVIVVSGKPVSSRITSLVSDKYEVCNPEPVTLTATGLNATSYRWYLSATGGSPIATTNANTLTVNVSATTVYYVASAHGTVENPTRVPITITIKPTPTDLTITKTNYPIGANDCNLNYVELTGTGGTYNSTSDITWTPITGLYRDAALTIPYTGGSATTVYATPNGTQTYTATASASASTCTKINTAAVTQLGKFFTGAVNKNWNVAGNWSPPTGGIPTLKNCVNIPNAKEAIVNITNAEAKTLTIASGGKINIAPEQALTVEGAVTNNDTLDSNFLVETNAILIQLNSTASNSGKIKVERYVQDMNNVLPTRMDYVYWSSPVFNSQIHNGVNSIFSPGTPLNRNYQYNESNDRFYGTPDQYFQLGKAYAIRAEISGSLPSSNVGYNKTYSFTGVPNNGYIDNYTLVKSSSVSQGYNLVGNPYPSNINADVLYDMNSANINKVFYFWTNNTPTPMQSGTGYLGNSYAVYTGTGGSPASSGAGSGSGWNVTEIPNGIIKATQGFMVQVKDGRSGQKLIFDNKNTLNNQILRVSNSGTFFQKSSKQKDRYWLTLTSPSNIINTILVGYVEGATNNFDYDYDAPQLVSSSDGIYTILGSNNLAVQGRKFPLDPLDVVPLGTTQYESGSYTLKLQNPEGIFNSEQKVYLKDKVLNIVTDLSSGSYTYLASKGSTTNRFELIYKPESTLGLTNTSAEKTQVYRDGEDFVVKSEIGNIDNLELFDAGGKLLHHYSPKSKIYRIEGKYLSKGMYILKIYKNTSSESIIKKILK